MDKIIIDDIVIKKERILVDDVVVPVIDIVAEKDYEKLENKPIINGVELIGNLSLEDLNIQEKGNYALQDDIPTKVSELENDSEYVNINSLPTKLSELENDENFLNDEEVDEIVAEAIKDLISNEELTEILKSYAKTSDLSSAISGVYSYINSALQSYATKSDLEGLATKSELSQYVLGTDLTKALSSLYNSISSTFASKSELNSFKAEVASNYVKSSTYSTAINSIYNEIMNVKTDYTSRTEVISRLKGYVSQSDLTTILEDYTTEEVVDDKIAEAVGGITSFDYKKLEEGEYDEETRVPTIEGKKGVIYLVPKTEQTKDIYIEYLWVGDDFELFGTTQMDLSDYVKNTDISTVAKTGRYEDLVGKPSIPSNTSDLTNDSNFITLADIPTIPTKTSDLVNDSDFVTSDKVPTKTSDLENDSNFAKVDLIPTKTSDLENDSGFITADDIPNPNGINSLDLSEITSDSEFTDMIYNLPSGTYSIDETEFNIRLYINRKIQIYNVYGTFTKYGDGSATFLELSWYFGGKYNATQHAYVQVESLMEGYATTEDLEGYATTEDLENYTTIEDVKNIIDGLLEEEF